MKLSTLTFAICLCLLVPQVWAGVNMKDYLAKKKARIEAEHRAQQEASTLYDNARTVGVGENLGRDKKATALNYTIYGGFEYGYDGKKVLVLHKIERAKGGGGGIFGGGNNVRNSFIISYKYTEPDEIYIQGSWIKVLEFDNVMLKFVVLEGRKRITHTENEKKKSPSRARPRTPSRHRSPYDR